MVKKAIITVAGYGTRFLPATKAQPKEMLPVIDKPVIQYIVEEVVRSGIKDIIFVTGRNKRAIEDHFDYAPELEASLLNNNKKDVFSEIRAISEMANFTYVRQKLPRGNGEAVLYAAHLINNEPVALIFGDDIIESRVPCVKQLINVFNRYNDCVIALQKVPMQETKKYGVVDAIEISDGVYEIKDIVEKPDPKEAPSNLAAVGRYIITPDLVEELKKLNEKSFKGELYIADGFKKLLRRRPIYGVLFDGKRYDCGSKNGYLQATVDFALKHPEVKTAFRKYLKSLKI